MCIRDRTYAAPLRVRARLINKETGEIKESEVYMGDFPLMTESCLLYTSVFIIAQRRKKRKQKPRLVCAG